MQSGAFINTAGAGYVSPTWLLAGDDYTLANYAVFFEFKYASAYA